jgi:predicted metal-dependent hydrolase
MPEQLEFPWFGRLRANPRPTPPKPPLIPWRVGGMEHRVKLLFKRNARRYVVRVAEEGIIQLTIPNRGTLDEGYAFLQRSEPWLEKRLHQVKLLPDKHWQAGTEVWFRGLRHPIRVEGRTVRVGEFAFHIDRDPEGDLRPLVERALRMLAERELPPRTLDFARMHNCAVARVSVRSQRSRWGSCSSKKVISLNWRLVQTPAAVRDYILLHELMHLREMNHSERYWEQVEAVCPTWRESERWLKVHGRSVLR